MASVEGSGVFVGRDREIAALTAALEAAPARGMLFLIAGEPGIGKSRLTDEFAEIARGHGARVLWGRCWEAGGAPPYWPWVQAIRTYLLDADDETLRAQLGPGAPDVAQMLPEITERFPDLVVPPSPDPDAARFRLFDSTSTFLRRAASGSPIMIVLEDIHAADTPTLLLLQFLAGVLPRTRLIVVATFRDTEVTAGDPLASALIELTRESSTRRISLGGFDKDEVSRFIEATTERVPSADLVLAVHNETEGNPLFVAEIVRLLEAEGRLERAMGHVQRLGIPEGVRAVIGRRVGHLSFECSRILGLASILGQEFSLDALGRLADVPATDLVQILDEAIAARVVAPVPGVVGRMRFSHALFRETLYDGLSVAQRIRLHRLAGETLEALSSGDPESNIAELAHHFFEAAGTGEAAKALDYARRAGARAASHVAYEEASRLFGMAFEALEYHDPKDDPTRCDLLLALGDAQARAGQMAEARNTLLRAVEIARRLGRRDAFGMAALAYGGRFAWVRAGDDPYLIPLLEEAAAAFGADDHPLRVRLLGRLSCALRDSRDRQRSDDLSREAVTIAERLDDPSTLAYALNARFAAIWWPDNVEQRFEIAGRFFDLTVIDKELMFQAYQLRTGCYFEWGDLVRTRQDVEAARILSEELRQPSQWWLTSAHDSLVSLIEGRYDDAEFTIEDAYRKGGRAQNDATSTYRSHVYLCRREQGRAREVEGVVRAAISDFPWYPVHKCILARLFVDTDRNEEARRLFEELCADRCSALPLDNEWLLGVPLLAEVCGALGDAPRAEMLYGLLIPYEHRNAHGHLEGSIGSVARYLGILAAVLSRFADAEAHFERALLDNDRMGARPFVAWTQFDFASMLLRRGSEGDRDRARALVNAARTTSRALGMTLLAGRLDELDGREDHAVSEPHVGVSGDHTFLREGEYWTIRFEAASFRIRDAKGMRYLAHLLASPGREHHALDMVTAVEGTAPDRPAPDREMTSAGAGDAAALLDPEAKEAYRRRLQELQNELDEARSWGDDERAVRAEGERDALVQQLAGAVGLGGRDRKAASNAERARVNVTRAIKAALARIAVASPALGAHLEATIRTGTFCSYTPDPRSPAHWRL